MYLSSIKLVAGTYTNVPPIKYTPCSCLIADPNPIGVFAEVSTCTCGSPVASDVRTSSAANLLVTLSVPFEVYTT